MQQNSTRLALGVVIAYALPSFGQALIHGPAGSILQAIYAKNFGLSLPTIAAIIFTVRMFDVLLDPMIGYSSDRFRVRFGTRKPWLVTGSVVAMISCWFLYAPTPPVDAQYFLIWFFLAYLGWTISEIPYVAWMAEVSQNYDDRTRLAAWRAIFLYVGTGAFFGIPYLPIFSTTEFTPETMRWSAILAIIVLPTTVWIAISQVPNGVVIPPTRKHSIASIWPAIIGNRPLLLFTLMFALSGLGSGMNIALLYFYFDNYMHQATSFAGLFLLTIPVGALAVPVWSYLCRIMGKQQAWAFGTLLGVFGLLSFPFIPQGADAPYYLAAALLFLISSFTVVAVAPPSMLADVVDYGKLKFGEDYAGTYFAFFTLINKALAGIGAALGLALASALGFDAAAKEMTETANIALLVSFSGIPALLNLLSIPVIWSFPIDAKQQKLIVQQLEQQKLNG